MNRDTPYPPNDPFLCSLHPDQNLICVLDEQEAAPDISLTLNTNPSVFQTSRTQSENKHSMPPDNPFLCMVHHATHSSAQCHQTTHFSARCHQTTHFSPNNLFLCTLLNNNLICVLDEQEAAREQIHSVCGGRQPGMDDRPNLTIMEANILETIRVVDLSEAKYFVHSFFLFPRPVF